MATALFCIGQVVLANDALTVTPVNLPQGGEAVVEVACSFEKSFKGYEMDIELSDGLTLTLDAEGKPMAEVAFGGTDHSVTTSQVGEGKYRFVCVSMSNKLLPTTGALLRVHVACPDGVAVGTAYTGRLTNMEFTTADMKATSIGDVTFSVIVAEPADTRVVLDENATTLPTAASGVDVRVKRKIKGGVWNTLVLPFSMTADQVVEAFGTDAELATFTAWESEEDKEGGVIRNGKKVEDATIAKYLRARIKWSGTFIVIIGEHTHERPWVNYEIKKAHDMGKQIVGIYDWNCKDKVELPEAYKKYGGSPLGWGSIEKLGNIIKGEVTAPETPDGTPAGPIFNMKHIICQ